MCQLTSPGREAPSVQDAVTSAYAGYCDDLSYKWVSNELIEISLGECESNDIRTLARKAYGVEFALK